MFVPRFVQLFRVLVTFLDVYFTLFDMKIHIKQCVMFISGSTKYLFPLGRVFSTFFETHISINRNDCHRPISYHEGAADRHTVGHFEPLLSHELRPASRAKQAVYGEVADVWQQQQVGGVQTYGATDLVHLGRTVARNPFLNVKVDKRLIKDHNDVFGEEILEFLRQLIVISTHE